MLQRCNFFEGKVKKMNQVRVAKIITTMISLFKLICCMLARMIVLLFFDYLNNFISNNVINLLLLQLETNLERDEFLLSIGFFGKVLLLLKQYYQVIND